MVRSQTDSFSEEGQSDNCRAKRVLAFFPFCPVSRTGPAPASAGLWIVLLPNHAACVAFSFAAVAAGALLFEVVAGVTPA